MLHVMNARCVARYLHTIESPDHLSIRVGGSSWRREEM